MPLGKSLARAQAFKRPLQQMIANAWCVDNQTLGRCDACYICNSKQRIHLCTGNPLRTFIMNEWMVNKCMFAYLPWLIQPSEKKSIEKTKKRTHWTVCVCETGIGNDTNYALNEWCSNKRKKISVSNSCRDWLHNFEICILVCTHHFTPSLCRAVYRPFSFCVTKECHYKKTFANL